MRAAAHSLAFLLATGALVACSAEESAGGLSTEHQAEVEALALPFMQGRWTEGMVVGLIDADGTVEIYGYGTTGRGDGNVPDGSTLFEIGSITKTFTALALALAVEEGSVMLDQPAQELLPAAEVTVPTRGGESIALRHLSMHTSGLPRVPDDLPANDPDPYADYGVEQLYAFLSGYSLPRDIGSEWEYSNLGVGLLGHALSLEAGLSYEELIRTRISEPLGLGQTTITLSGEQQQRFAQGHDADLVPAPPFHFDVLAGAGALRSTAMDLLQYAGAQTGVVPSDLADAMQSTHAEQLTVGPGVKMGLGWFIGEDRYRWHNGMTGSFGTFVGIDPVTGVGVTVLCNAVGAVYVPDLALGNELLRMMAGEPYNQPDLPATLALPTETLEKYAGTYEITGVTFDIVRVDDHLVLRPADQPDYRMYAQTEESFYLRLAPVSVTFLPEPDGSYDSLRYEREGSPPAVATRVP